MIDMEANVQHAVRPMRHVGAALPVPWLLTGIMSGALLWLCYFPVGWGFLAWIALVPFLALVRLPASKGRLFWGAYVAGLVFFLPVLQWLRVADWRMYGTWLMLTAYCSLYFPLALWLLRRLDAGTRLSLVITLPLVWVGLEFVRSFFLTGFAWYFLGHTQHRFLELIQLADVGGVYLISLVVAAVNAWVFELAWHFPRVRTFLKAELSRAPAPTTALAWQAGVLAALFGGALFYGNYRLGESNFQGGPRVALLQGNLDQRLRNQATQANGIDAQAKVLRSYERLNARAVAPSPTPDLVVWPETSFPYYWVELPADLNEVSPAERQYAEVLRARMGVMGESLRVPFLLGLNSSIWEDAHKPTVYNSALLLDAGGGPAGRYDKIHRVPFGEYVPLKEWLPFMNKLAPYDFDYGIAVGKKLTRFTLGNFRFGVLICYEDTDPTLARNYGVGDEHGPPVDFLVNISNDGWFDGTSEHEEHLALCRFRAIESRKPVARAVNMGISAVIDSNGRVLNMEKVPEFTDVDFWVVRERLGKVAELPVAEWSRFKKTEGIVYAGMPIDRRVSLYAVWGDWLPWVCWILVAMGLAWSWQRESALAKSSG